MPSPTESLTAQAIETAASVSKETEIGQVIFAAILIGIGLLRIADVIETKRANVEGIADGLRKDQPS